MEVNLVRGIPGSGKSTFAKTMFPNVLHLENDFFHYRNGKYEFDPNRQLKAVRWCLKSLEVALQNGMDVCISNTYTKTEYIEEVRKIAEKYGAKFTVYRMFGIFQNIHEVPLEVIRRMTAQSDAYTGEKYVVPLDEGGYKIS